MADYVVKGIDVILTRIKANPTIAKPNKTTIEKHIAFLRARDSNPKTIYKHLFCLEKFIVALGRTDASKANKEDIEAAISKINSLGLATETKRNIRTIVKQFYKHLLGEDMYYPRQVAWIKTSSANKDKMLPEDLITENEIIKMIKATKNPRDKAIIALLFDSGIRAGELLGLRKKDIDFNSEPAHIRVSGKTGMRRIPIMFSVPYVSKYMDIMDDLGASDIVWKDLGSRSNGGKTLNQGGLNTMLKKVCARAGMEKRIYAHLFRHSRASNYANKLTEQQLKAFFGWTGGSRMAATYVHLSGRDIDNAVLQANGVKPKEQDNLPVLTVKICPRCRKVNEISSMHCSTCGSALDIVTALKEKEMREDIEEMGVKKIKGEDFKSDIADNIKKKKKDAR